MDFIEQEEVGLIFKVATYFLSSPEDMLINFREGGRKGERERERNIDMRKNIYPLRLLCAFDLRLNPQPRYAP